MEQDAPRRLQLVFCKNGFHLVVGKYFWEIALKCISLESKETWFFPSQWGMDHVLLHCIALSWFSDNITGKYNSLWLLLSATRHHPKENRVTQILITGYQMLKVIGQVSGPQLSFYPIYLIPSLTFDIGFKCLQLISDWVLITPGYALGPKIFLSFF